MKGKIAADRKRGEICPLGSHCNYRVLDSCRVWSKQVTYHYFPYSVMGCHRMYRHMDIFHYCRCISDETRI